ncbi:hypothetical protein E2C01_010316 [Portunus trituberculatus]|uniref:Uncharacterized protein n=1 Tax=Portunus trituberculatus TaxID=210409 RepID=A0A5B7D823_PORTR|nr:hypothetical protein [Portunus trituberculatus]
MSLNHHHHSLSLCTHKGSDAREAETATQYAKSALGEGSSVFTSLSESAVATTNKCIRVTGGDTGLL